MAVAYVEATGVTTPDNFSLAAGASKPLAVNSPDDEATSYIASSTTLNTYQYLTASPGLSPGDLITQIEAVIRARRGGANDVTLRVGYAFTPQGGGSQTSESAAGAMTAVTNWTTFTFTHSGLSVPWGSDLQFWVRNTQGRILHVTTFYLVITYTPAATVAAGPLVNAPRLKSKLRGLA